MSEELDNQQLASGGAACGVSEGLSLEANAILAEELTADDSTRTLSNVPLNDMNGNTYLDKAWVEEYGKKLTTESSELIWSYHKSEIDNVSKTMNVTLFTLLFVSVLTAIAIPICAVLDRDIAIVSGITGGVIDVILAALAGVLNTTLKSKKSYFDAANDSDKFNKMLMSVQTISDKEKKDSLTEDIVRKFFDINKK